MDNNTLLYKELITQIEANTIDYDFCSASPTGQHLLNLPPEQVKGFIFYALDWLKQRSNKSTISVYNVEKALSLLLLMLKNTLSFKEEEIISLMQFLADVHFLTYLPTLLTQLERFKFHNPITPDLQQSVQGVLQALMDTPSAYRYHRVKEMKILCEITDNALPILAGEAWSDVALADIQALPNDQQQGWNLLLNLCTKATSSKPSAKWLKMAEVELITIGITHFKTAICRWFPLVDKPRTQAVTDVFGYGMNGEHYLTEENINILKGLVWLCASHADTDIARALMQLALASYRKLSGIGARCLRLGNATVWALGNIEGMEGVIHLSLIRHRIKLNSILKLIDKTLVETAQRLGIPPEEIEEMAIPTYGLQTIGYGEESLGAFTAILSITDSNTVKLTWRNSTGKLQTSVPQAVKTEYPEELKQLNQTIKDIRKLLPVQKERLDNLYLQQRTWDKKTWEARYINHPLVGIFARRLLWQFQQGDNITVGIFHKNNWLNHDDKPLADLPDNTQVCLWHPLYSTVDDVLAWRDWLMRHEVQQPFKQAHREVYLLTDAERKTDTYSNRYAAHILKQHQFNALCSAREWKNKLRLMHVDDSCPPATRTLPHWQIRAEYWIEGAGHTYGADTNDTGTFLYLSTDQVRFYPIDTVENHAHMGGGGYRASSYLGGVTRDPIPLKNIPALVFSEIMRDVDLFVGVASVGNDPAWLDGGVETQQRTYWHSYSFGALSETAKTRRQVLEKLLPCLKIASRCQFTDKFLQVRGDLRTYNIHLGSGNILMSPNDQYLCIVPARGEASTNITKKVFLPFEGDSTLAIILSKAFLLADDKNIKDLSILRQIQERI
ncbi:DUF4132 domain-containing protein [Beggiatoa leptomitoformis]|uniref:DUF4132 domain-containing protein n=1 Tax=Beggiatoa leptomitoformis TaxID=288004 RepID=A0A2N9YCH0_9GAMM|nr:DUF4132 domain-containing protein [Beggiatoa leptomitoformis]AUI68168.1 DUF4132 domain-containing protein [Beggiatoa leptomitoformis]QGX03441.1 DUF4132 domain-containing protein [Beggiatoa leptomitoformis]